MADQIPGAQKAQRPTTRIWKRVLRKKGMRPEGGGAEETSLPTAFIEGGWRSFLPVVRLSRVDVAMM